MFNKTIISCMYATNWVIFSPMRYHCYILYSVKTGAGIGIYIPAHRNLFSEMDRLTNGNSEDYEFRYIKTITRHTRRKH